MDDDDKQPLTRRKEWEMELFRRYTIEIERPAHVKNSDARQAFTEKPMNKWLNDMVQERLDAMPGMKGSRAYVDWEAP